MLPRNRSNGAAAAAEQQVRRNASLELVRVLVCFRVFASVLVRPVASVKLARVMPAAKLRRNICCLLQVAGRICTTQ